MALLVSGPVPSGAEGDSQPPAEVGRKEQLRGEVNYVRPFAQSLIKEHKCNYMQVTTLSKFRTNINHLPIQIWHLHHRRFVLESRSVGGRGGYESS